MSLFVGLSTVNLIKLTCFDIFTYTAACARPSCKMALNMNVGEKANAKICWKMSKN